MKKLIYFIPLILFLLFLVVLPSEAAYTGNNNTTTTLSTFGYEYGSNQTLTATTLDNTGSSVAMGNTVFAEVTNSKEIGTEYITGSSMSNNFTYTYTATQTINIIGFKVPVDDIQINPQLIYIKLEIFQGITPVFKGQLQNALLQQSQNDGFLMFLLGTYAVDIPASNSMTLTAGYTYEFFLSGNDANAEITIPISDTTSNIVVSNANGVIGSSYVYLLEGNILGEISTTNGVASIGYTIPLGTRTIIAQYSAPFLYTASYAIQSFVTNNVNLAISIADIQTHIGGLTTFSAGVTIGGNVLENAQVEFFLNRSGTFEKLGTANTDILGVANIDQNLDLSAGNYSYVAVASYLDQSCTSTAIIEVSRPQAFFSQFSSTAKYIDGGTTIVQISGKVRDAKGINLDGVSVNILYSNASISTQSISGSITANFEVNELPGTYTNYITVQNTGLYYNIADLNFDLVVNKGDQNLDFTAIPTEFLSQPVIITGTVKNDLLENINTTVQLLEEIEGQFVYIASGTLSGSVYSINVPIHEAGTYNLQVISAETSLFAAGSQFLSLVVQPSNLTISRDTFSTTINIKYRAIGDISVLITDGIDPLSNVELEYSINSPQQIGIFTSLGIYSTNSSGWTTTGYTMNDFYSFTYTVKVEVVDTSFNYQLFYLYIKPATVKLSMDVIDFTGFVGEQINFEYNIIDEFDNLADNNTLISVDIDGTSSAYFTSNGKINFNRVYSAIGTHTLTFTQAPFPGNPYTMDVLVITLTIDHGQYLVVASDLTSTQGLNQLYSAVINSNARNNIQGILTSLYVYTNAWIFIGSTQSDANGIVSITALQELDVGNYQLKWETEGNVNYYMGILHTNLTVVDIQPKLDIANVASYYYGNNPQAVVTLSVDGVGVISGMDISISLDSYSWNLTTDVNGKVYIPLPSDITPGVYNLVANFAGTGNYLAASNSNQIEILGNPTTTTIVQYYPSYYAEWTNLTVRVTDQSAPLAGIDVELHIDGQTFVATTNSKGYAYFEIYLQATEGTYSIYANIVTIGGYEYSEDSVIFTHIVKDLNIIVDYFNQIYYSDSLSMNITTKYDIGIPNVSILMEIQLATNWETVITLVTDANGKTSLNYIPIYDVGNYTIRLSFSHVKYRDVIQNIDLNILKMPLTYSLDNSIIGVYGQTTTLELSIYNIHGELISGINVSAGILQNTMQILDTCKLSNGYARFVFIPPNAGTNYIQVLSGDNNYKSPVNAITINVLRSQTRLQYQLSDENGAITIQPMLLDIYDNEIVSDFTLYFFNTTWIEQSTGKSFVFTISEDTQFRIEFKGTTDLEMSYVGGNIAMRNITHHNNVYSAEYPNLNYSTKLSDSLENYEVNYLINGISGTIFTTGDTLEFSLPLGISPGVYTITFNFPNQANYYEYNWTQEIIVTRGTPVLEVPELILTMGDLISIRVNVSLNSEILMKDGTIELHVNGEFYSSSIVLNGRAFFNYNAQNYGIYSFEYRLLETGNTITVSEFKDLRVKILPKLKASISSGYYTDDNQLHVELTLDSAPANGITVYANINNSTFSAVVSGGTADIILSGDFLPGYYNIFVYTKESDVYLPINFTLLYQIKLEKVHLSYDIIDLGITNGYKVLVTVTDESGPLTGIFSWNLPSESGNGDLGTPLYLSGELLGSFNLTLSFSTDGYEFVSDSTIIGFSSINTVDIKLVYDRVPYGILPQLNITHNDLPLSNIDIKAEYDGFMLIVKTNSKGIATLNITGEANKLYSLSVTIPKSQYITNKINLDLKFEFERGEKAFLINAEDILWGEDLSVEIIDDYQGYYSVNIDSIFIGNVTQLQFTFPADYAVGEHILSITRYHHNLLTQSEKVYFKILPHQVEIDIQMTENGNNLLLKIFLNDNENIVQHSINLTISVYYVNYTVFQVQDYWMEFPEYNLESMGPGSYIIEVEIHGIYEGMSTKTITIEEKENLIHSLNMSSITAIVLAFSVGAKMIDKFDVFDKIKKKN